MLLATRAGLPLATLASRLATLGDLGTSTATLTTTSTRHLVVR